MFDFTRCGRFLLATPLVLIALGFGSQRVFSKEWSIPLGGNVFRSQPESARSGLRRGGELRIGSPQEVYVVHFHVDRPAKFDIAISARAIDAPSNLKVAIGDQIHNLTIPRGDAASHTITNATVEQAGYVPVRLSLVSNESGAIELSEFVVTSDKADLTVDFVRNNEGNMFYWGRRGPSVHLGYQLPRDVTIEYAYSEITVPAGNDVIGSYYMANGFGEGYFGIQVNGPEERRVLFSVWSPFSTDNPRDIPEDQRIIALAKGDGVHLGEFGNEGSGGQSYLVYPWKAGVTYRFLTKVQPDGNGNTVYTCWFGDKSANEWRLIASFQRPKTDTHLRGFHSFLENFSPETGHITRSAQYGNVWVCDTVGNWHAINKARFSVDATGGGRHRLDFTGGSEGDVFYLKNCGFFNETGTPGEIFERELGNGQPPELPK